MPATNQVLKDRVPPPK